MVIFKKLELNTEGTEIELMANIRQESYFDNVYIKSIKADTQDTYVEGGAPSQNAITVAEYADEDYVKSVDLHLTTQDLNNLDLLKNFFVFYVQVTGTPTSDVPCGLDNEYTIGVIYNKPSIYTQGLNLLKGLGDTCEVSPDILNFIAQTNGLDYALETGNLPDAINYWKSFFSEIKTPTITNRCCCHG